MTNEQVHLKKVSLVVIFSENTAVVLSGGSEAYLDPRTLCTPLWSTLPCSRACACGQFCSRPAVSRVDAVCHNSGFRPKGTDRVQHLANLSQTE